MRYEQFSIRETLADPFGGTLALNACLTIYLSDNTPEIDAARRHPMVLICPGGGYTMTSDREAEPGGACIFGKGLSRGSAAVYGFAAWILSDATV